MAQVREILNKLRLDPHPDRTFVGRASKRFQFLGYHFFDGALGVAAKNCVRMTEIAAQFYKQVGRRYRSVSLGLYRTRWHAWFRSGLEGLNLSRDFLAPFQDPTGRSQSRQ